jgi:hypothetical protein
MSCAGSRLTAVFVLAVVGASSAWAHHSYTMFDASRTALVTGTVRSLEWMNPHVWLWVTVTDEKGTTAPYAFEGTSVGEMMRRSGWTRNTVRPGDKVAVKYHPFKDGKDGGKLDAVTLSDGRTMSVLSRAGGP